MNDLQIFSYESKQIRTILINKEPWWIAADVCKVLELTDVSMSVSRLEEDEKLVQKLFVSGQNRDILLINESGLYSLILRSNKPEAKKFKKWITAEVLPSIRKTGQYSLPKSDEELILIGYEKLMQKVKALTPKADAYDKFLSTDGVKDMAVVAQELFGDKIGRNTLLKKLRECGILKSNNQPHQQYMQYFKVIPITKTIGDKTVTFDTTYVRPKGMDYIAKRFNLIREVHNELHR